MENYNHKCLNEYFKRQQCQLLSWEVDDNHTHKKGDNYSSALVKVKCKVQTNGGQRELTVLTKEPQRKSKHVALFSREITAYSEILPKLQELCTRINLGEITWPIAYASADPNFIVLEDLTVHGFKMGDRHKGLDWSHARLAVQGLAKFHAESSFLLHRGELTHEKLPVTIYSKLNKEFEASILGSLHFLNEIIFPTWTSEWKNLTGKFSDLLDNIMDDIQKICEVDPKRFNTVCHGDPWINNILCRCDENSQPVSVRFVDYQLCHYNSYAFDLQYFIATSLSDEIRESHYQALLNEYHQALRTVFNQIGWTPQPMPTLDSIKIEMNRTLLFQLMVAAVILPVIKSPPELSPILDGEGSQDLQSELKKTEARMRREEYQVSLKAVFKHLYKLGFFN